MISDLILNGRYKEAEIILKNKKINDIIEEKSTLNLLLAEVYLGLGEFIQAEEYAEIVFTEDKDISRVIRAKIYFFESKIYVGNTEVVLDEVNSILEYLTKVDLPDRDYNILSFSILAIKIHLRSDLGHFDKIDVLISQLLNLAIIIDEDLYYIKAYHQKARVNDFLGNLKLAEMDYLLALEYAKGTTYHLIKTSSMHNLANIYYYKGQFDKSLEMYDKEVEILKQLGSIYYIAISNSDRAWTYFSIGEIDKSLNIFEECYNYLQARKNIDVIFSSEVRTRMIIILCHIGRRDEAEIYLKEIEDIKENHPHERIGLFYDLSLATILKTFKRVRARAKSMDLFEKIAFEPIFDMEFTVYAYLSLTELYVFDYSLVGEEKTLKEIEFLVSKLYDYADDQDSLSINSEANWLNAKIHLLKGEFDKAKDLLSIAMVQAENTGFENLARQISDDLDDLEYKIQVDPNLLDTQKLDLANIILFNKQVDDKEHSILFFIMGDTGLPLYSKVFSETIEFDENLISSFLNAINLFGRQALHTNESLRRIQYHEFIILIENYENLNFIYVIKGKSYQAKQKLSNLIYGFFNSEYKFKINSKSMVIHPDTLIGLDHLVAKYIK